ncbi:unnamed protein product [Arctogadus glacialis]
MHKFGDVILGGIFPINYYTASSEQYFTSEPKDPICYGFDIQGFRQAQTMAFAVDEINRNSKLLPNISLGYSLYDSCVKLGISFRAALSMTSGRGEPFQLNESCYGYPPLLGIVGESTSTHTIAISSILSLYSLPMVSYFATCSCLSDRKQFPSFFRTIPSDAFQVVKQNVTGLQWIASEAWSTAKVLHSPSYMPFLAGTLGIAIRRGEIPGLRDFLLTIRPDNDTLSTQDNTLVKQFWEHIFRCKFVSGWMEMEGSGPFKGQSCARLQGLEPWQLVYYLQRVNFTTDFGDQVSFDENGDVLPIYDVMNWRWHPDGSTVVTNVGDVKEMAAKVIDLNLDEDKIFWNFESKKPPRSVCSESCPPGTRIAIKKGEPVCCFDCIPCSDGKISNGTDSTECTSCPEDFWSNIQRDQCFPKSKEFLSYVEPLGISFTTASLFGALLCTIVLGIFTHHRTTPVVRANNSELSFLILLSLKLCFLCSLFFIGKPRLWTCQLRHAAFGISFVLCVSCILVKTMVVLAVFKASKPAPNENTEYYSDRIVVECVVGSTVGFGVLLGYIGLLAVLSFLLAFLARNLPDNFNEAKFITFSTLVFCAVWIAFIPAYINSPGKYADAVEVFAILASSFVLLLALFGPKCYIILLKPEKNTKKALMGRGSPRS